MAGKKRHTKSDAPQTTDTQQSLRLEWRSPAELAENPHNWRTHPQEQISALTDVLSEVGWAGACLYNETTGKLIDGHARRKVAIEQGADKVPVLVGSWTPEQEAKILATFDPIGAMASADKARLDALLRDVQTGSEALGKMLTDLAAQHGVIPGQAVTPGEGGDEFDTGAALEGECRVKPGDIWIVDGKHRICCGDSTDGETVSRLMDGAKASLCFTSPPYAQQRDYGEKAKEKVKDWDALMQGVFTHLPMTDDGQVLVNLGLIHREGEWVPYWDGWIEWMRGQGWRRFGWYVWDQQRGLPGDWNGRLAPSHEFIFHFNRIAVDPVKHVECNVERAARERRQIQQGAVKTGLRNKDGIVVELSSPDKVGQSHKVPDSVFRFERHMANDIARLNHPATYPVSIVEHALKSWPGDIYDPFAGSGTTLIAAHRLSRRAFLCEIEPKYCEVILRRAEAENLSVQKAEASLD